MIDQDIDLTPSASIRPHVGGQLGIVTRQ